MFLRASLAAISAFVLAAASAPAAGTQPRLEIWDLALGSHAADIPDDFVDYACGTRGGPPSRPLAHFSDFALCRADAAGLHEVYFRYDDELEYRARALEQSLLIEEFAGTKVYGYPAVVSALFDDSGVLAGIRIVTDPRGATPGTRADFWALGRLLQARFGNDGWECSEIPLQDGEAEIGLLLVKANCSKVADGLTFRTEQRFLRRRGQNYLDGLIIEVVPNAFESSTLFEMIVTPASAG